MRYNGAYSLTLATRALASALLFFLVCEAGHVCFEVYATQVRPSPPSSRGVEQVADDLSCSRWPSRSSPRTRTRRSSRACARPTLTSRCAPLSLSLSVDELLPKLTSLLSQSFAFLELSLLTLTDPARRQAIFKDVKPGSASAGAWAEISRECLLLIGTELQRAKGRGRLPSTCPSLSPAPSPPRASRR